MVDIRPRKQSESFQGIASKKVRGAIFVELSLSLIVFVIILAFVVDIPLYLRDQQLAADLAANVTRAVALDSSQGYAPCGDQNAVMDWANGRLSSMLNAVQAQYGLGSSDFSIALGELVAAPLEGNTVLDSAVVSFELQQTTSHCFFCGASSLGLLSKIIIPGTVQFPCEP